MYILLILFQQKVLIVLVIPKYVLLDRSSFLFCFRKCKHCRLIDESLRWLIANGKVERAKTVLQKACRINKKNYNELVIVSGFRGAYCFINTYKHINASWCGLLLHVSVHLS